MAIERIHLNEEKEKQLGYCQAVRAGNLIYVSGAVSWDDTGQPLHVGDMAKQIEEIYKALSNVLSNLGLNFAHVVKENGYTVNFAETMNVLGLRADYYKNGLPASTWVEVSGLVHPDLMVEIELIVLDESA